MIDAKAVDQTISCVITDLPATHAVSVTWVDADGNDIDESDTTNYAVDQGKASLNGGSQTTQLTIKKSKLISLTSPSTFKCSVTSGEYPTSGAFKTDVDVTLGIGKHFVYYLCSSFT